MSFTQSTVTHTFINGDGSVASGVVNFKLTSRMTNGTETVMATEIDATLNSSGQLTQSLCSTEDVGTVPNDVMWEVTIRLTGSNPETYSVTVPPGPGTTDLGSLLPGNQQVA